MHKTKKPRNVELKYELKQLLFATNDKTYIVNLYYL